MDKSDTHLYKLNFTSGFTILLLLFLRSLSLEKLRELIGTALDFRLQGLHVRKNSILLQYLGYLSNDLFVLLVGVIAEIEDLSCFFAVECRVSCEFFFHGIKVALVAPHVDAAEVNIPGSTALPKIWITSSPSTWSRLVRITTCASFLNLMSVPTLRLSCIRTTPSFLLRAHVRARETSYSVSTYLVSSIKPYFL